MEQEVENMKWYVLRVMGGKENKTVSFIEKEIDRLGMRDFVAQILVPTEKVYLIRNGKKVIDSQYSPLCFTTHGQFDGIRFPAIWI